jgi:multidrug efflux pump subunit AcrB
MVAQFNSATTPFIIMTTVVLSLIGVFLGLVITQMDFVVIFTSVGIISLAGIVVNNAIVLVDYANLLLSRKRVEKGLNEEDRLVLNDVYEAIVEAGQKRLRPVLLTAITTILGLLPLATGMNINFFTLVSAYDPQIYFGGDNAAFWGPMAWTVIYGLTFATFLTLVMVPVMLYLLSAIKSRFGMRVV